MKRYEKYKDSGIEWIGEIPAHWEVKKIKYISKLQGGYAFKSELFCEDGIPIIRIGDINNPIDWENCKKVPEELEIPDDFVLRQFDTLIALSGATTGKTAFINTKPEYAYINQRVAKVGFPNKLLYFNISSDIVQKLILLTADGSAQENISNSQIENLEIAIPPSFEEQTAIADYLDCKTAQIEELIAGKKRLLELYEEEKNAIINQAVTKGINPNVPMKDSGIEWLGEIPAHWEVKKISYCFKTIGSGTTPKSNNPDYYNGDFNWLQTGDLNDGIIVNTSKKITQKALDDYTTLRFYPIGSVVIAMYGATIGKLGLLNIETTTNQACCALANPKNVDSKFVFYWFLSVRQEIISLSYGGGQPNINQEQIKNLKLQVPPPEEQKAIVNYIEKEIARINAKVEKTKKLIELLEEYKQALISELVTGKIKVI